MSRLIAFALVPVVACGSGGGDRDAGVVPVPVMAPPPAGIEVTGPLFALDVATHEMASIVHGDAGLELRGVLASPGGQRTLVLVREGQREIVAAAGWHLSPVAAVRGGALLVCWNRLTGPASPSGGMPHPSHGLALICRQRDAAGWSAELDAAGDNVPRWLRDLDADATGVTLTYLRDAAGWLVRPDAPGDGLYQRRFEAGSFADERLVAPALPD